MAMLLDEDIRTRSNGEKSLEYLMRWMHKNFPRNEHLYQLEDIAAGLKAVSGYDYTEFLRRYVDGKETIPVAQFFNVRDAIWSYKFNHNAKPDHRFFYQTLGISVSEDQPGFDLLKVRNAHA